MEKKSTVDNASHKTSNHTDKGRSHRAFAFFGAVIVLFIVFIAVISIRINGYDKVFPNTYINDTNLEGKSADEIISFLDSKYSNEKLAGLKINLICGDASKELPLEALDIKFNNTETTANIFENGNETNVVARAFRFLFCKLHKTDINPVYEYNTTALADAVTAAATNYETEPVGVTFELNTDRVILHKQTDGIMVDRSEVEAIINDSIKAMRFNDVYLEPKSIHPEDLDFNKFYAWLTNDAEDAYYEKNAENSVTVHPEKLKCIVDKETVKNAIEQLKSAEGGTVEFSVETNPPENTTEKLQQILYTDKLSSYSTNYGGTSARVNNVQLAVSRINGYEMLPGEEFSYDKTILPRNAANGYQAAPVYVGNKVESGMGGGICQPSSTLYCAALYANLEIVERHNHSLLVSYLPPGLDATIAEGVLDLKFKNSTPYPIKIAASAASGTVTFSIWGYNPERYSVELLRSGGGYSYQVTRVVKKDGAEVARQKMSSSLYNKPEEEKKEEPPRQTQAPQQTQNPTAAENKPAAAPESTAPQTSPPKQEESASEAVTQQAPEAAAVQEQ